MKIDVYVIKHKDGHFVTARSSALPQLYTSEAKAGRNPYVYMDYYAGEYEVVKATLIVEDGIQS